MMQNLRLSNGDPLTLGSTLGAGDEGTVFAVADRDDVVAKIYHPHRITPAHIKKIHAMLATPPEDVMRRSPHTHMSFTWPIALVFDGTSEVGYLMPRLKIVNPLAQLMDPRLRQQHHGQLNHRHFYRTARNLALAMELLHNKNVVIGDVNATNVLFTYEALVTLIDCDAMQITAADGVIHRCNIGEPEYTPPELHDTELFSEMNRTANHDTFGLAVLIFQLLMQGLHPFMGRAKPGTPDVAMAHIHCLRQHIFPYLENHAYAPPVIAPHFGVLPQSLQTLFIRAFTNIDNRPTAKEWAQEIRAIEQRLVPCPHNTSHYHPSDGACVICAWEHNVRAYNNSTAPTSPEIQAVVPTGVPANHTQVAPPDVQPVPPPVVSQNHTPAPQPPVVPPAEHLIDDTWQPQPQHIEIAENQTGVTYQNLFGDYLVDAYHIKVTDPYIRSPYQMRNLMEFIETVARFGDQHSEITIDLVTSIDPGNAQRQLDLLNQIQNRAVTMNVLFDWGFAPNLHDRSIIIDHGRWKIVLGRGLDIYAQWDADMFNPLIRYPEMRPCKAFTVTYLDLF
jgi:DNA-binding helix-hairpin-helix protein with protein kinase domain